LMGRKGNNMRRGGKKKKKLIQAAKEEKKKARNVSAGKKAVGRRGWKGKGSLLHIEEKGGKKERKGHPLWGSDSKEGALGRGRRNIIGTGEKKATLFFNSEKKKREEKGNLLPEGD